MARPDRLTLSAKDQKAALKAAKTTRNARKVAETLGLSRHQVMYLFEKNGLASYSEGSYA